LSLVILTTVAAAVLALLQPLDLPPWLHLLFAAYAIVFAAYVVLRGIHMVRRSIRLRREARANREQLRSWIEERRVQQATTNPDDGAL
jgi:uncharacterized membrane protein